MESVHTNAMTAFTTIFRRDIKLALRHRSELINPLAFFVIVVSLFPLGLSADSRTLLQIAPAILWISALLATMLSLESIFRSDYEDGSLEQLVLSDHPLFVIVLGKVAAHWCTTGLLLTLISPALAISLAFPPQNLGTLLWTLLLGTPTLSLIGSIGVALTVGLRRGGILLALLILPLYIPILIFGASAVDMSIDDLDVGGQLYLLAALLVLSLTLAPFATSAALRVTLE